MRALPSQGLVHHSDLGTQYLQSAWQRSVLRRRPALSAMPTTMSWPRPSLACTRPKSSGDVACEDTSTPSTTPRWNKSTGLIIAAYSSRSATFHQRSSSRQTINFTTRRPWRRESTNELSGKPSAVQSLLLRALAPILDWTARWASARPHSSEMALGALSRLCARQFAAAWICVAAGRVIRIVSEQLKSSGEDLPEADRME